MTHRTETSPMTATAETRTDPHDLSCRSIHPSGFEPLTFGSVALYSPDALRSRREKSPRPAPLPRIAAHTPPGESTRPGGGPGPATPPPDGTRGPASPPPPRVP